MSQYPNSPDLGNQSQSGDSVFENIWVFGKLNYPFEGRIEIVGTLAGLEDSSVVLQVDEDEYLLPLENVQKARIVPVFD